MLSGIPTASTQPRLLAAPSVPSRHRRPDLFTGFLRRINPSMENAISAKRAASRRPRLKLERSVWLTIATPFNVRPGGGRKGMEARRMRACVTTLGPNSIPGLTVGRGVGSREPHSSGSKDY